LERDDIDPNIGCQRWSTEVNSDPTPLGDETTFHLSLLPFPSLFVDEPPSRPVPITLSNNQIVMRISSLVAALLSVAVVVEASNEVVRSIPRKHSRSLLDHHPNQLNKRASKRCAVKKPAANAANVSFYCCGVALRADDAIDRRTKQRRHLVRSLLVHLSQLVVVDLVALAVVSPTSPVRNVPIMVPQVSRSA
jgi:hypothetical protein